MRRLFPILAFSFAVFAFRAAEAATDDCQVYDLSMPSPQIEVDLAQDVSQVGVQLGGPVFSGRQIITSAGGCPHGDNYVGMANAVADRAGVTWKYQGESYPLYKTGIDGVGVAIGLKAVGLGTADWTPVDSSNYFWSSENSYDDPGWLEVMLIYVSTGPIKPGTYAFPQTNLLNLRYAHLRTPYIEYDSGYMYIGAGSVTHEGLGCDLVDSEIDVNLHQVSASEYLKGVGSVSPAEHFSIPLQCNGEVAIDMTVSSSGAADASKGLLRVDSGGASGVAIQLLQADGVTIMPLGEEVRIIPQATLGQNTINMAARYYQNASKVVVGKAKGTAQFTLKYR
ncbi:fimbrial protein [Pseudomonas sp. URMO17WK12:I12]|uniref:fimbrial protein n=1 Tax=Pseudomonas sp. URMO17WK12:I12 TaxID=1259797 RepID=UPI00047FD892|nr:fimbrial protein [Pseudomonas sp. URMO17WK12:I12]